MRLSVSKKLIGGFSVIVGFLLISNVIGLVMLNKVDRLGKLVGKEKGMIQYAASQAALSILKVQSSVSEASSMRKGLSFVESKIKANISDFDMWNACNFVWNKI